MEPYPGSERSTRGPLPWRAAVGLSLFAASWLAGCAAAPVLPTAGESPPEACVPSEKGGCLPVAPESDRVDLMRPTFSHPTDVTNPLHPSSDLHSAVMLGQSGGQPFRTEITLLPATKTIEWNGQTIEALESQYVAYVDGRIEEVALDWYAQADDGSVWYLGEDVFNYEDGVVADTGGTWMAGRDGPGAMIMPADPQVGDVYRPENIPGVVFEEVTVRQTGQTVDGPHGPVAGAILVDELHMDGGHEEKTFAPGYGEFSTGSGANLDALALGVPADALAGPPPAELATLFSAAVDIDASVALDEWQGAERSFDALTGAWEAYRSDGVPPLLESRMNEELDALGAALGARDPEQTRQAALRAAIAGLDFQLRYLPPEEIDRKRFGLWLRQVRLDADGDDAAGVAGDAAVLEWIRDRLASHWAEGVVADGDALLAELRAAADAEDVSAASDAAVRLAALLADS